MGRKLRRDRRDLVVRVESRSIRSGRRLLLLLMLEDVMRLRLHLCWAWS
jgi:hypothetical protein